jgi:hypothetical protein
MDEFPEAEKGYPLVEKTHGLPELYEETTEGGKSE